MRKKNSINLVYMSTKRSTIEFGEKSSVWCYIFPMIAIREYTDSLNAKRENLNPSRFRRQFLKS